LTPYVTIAGNTNVPQMATPVAAQGQPEDLNLPDFEATMTALSEQIRATAPPSGPPTGGGGASR
jgi:hypothetical protein